MNYDVFISHASEDKESFVSDLADGLRECGLSVWYDSFTLKLGDSLSNSISKGLSNSSFGIVVLSPNFFAKQWPQRELNTLIAREDAGDKVILPIWHNVDKKDILKHSPLLADKLAVLSKEGVPVVIKQILEVVEPSVRLRDPNRLPVEEMTIRLGTVSKFYNIKGFGFISAEDGKEYFVHTTGIEDGRSFSVNDKVVFLTEKGDRGVKAVAVRRI